MWTVTQWSHFGFAVLVAFGVCSPIHAAIGINVESEFSTSTVIGNSKTGEGSEAVGDVNSEITSATESCSCVAAPGAKIVKGPQTGLLRLFMALLGMLFS